MHIIALAMAATVAVGLCNAQASAATPQYLGQESLTSLFSQFETTADIGLTPVRVGFGDESLVCSASTYNLKPFVSCIYGINGTQKFSTAIAQSPDTSSIYNGFIFAVNQTRLFAATLSTTAPIFGEINVNTGTFTPIIVPTASSWSATTYKLSGSKMAWWQTSSSTSNNYDFYVFDLNTGTNVKTSVVGSTDWVVGDGEGNFYAYDYGADKFTAVVNGVADAPLSTSGTAALINPVVVGSTIYAYAGVKLYNFTINATKGLVGSIDSPLTLPGTINSLTAYGTTLLCLTDTNVTFVVNGAVEGDSIVFPNATSTNNVKVLAISEKLGVVALAVSGVAPSLLNMSTRTLNPQLNLPPSTPPIGIPGTSVSAFVGTKFCVIRQISTGSGYTTYRLISYEVLTGVAVGLWTSSSSQVVSAMFPIEDLLGGVLVMSEFPKSAGTISAVLTNVVTAPSVGFSPQVSAYNEISPLTVANNIIYFAVRLDISTGSSSSLYAPVVGAMGVNGTLLWQAAAPADWGSSTATSIGFLAPVVTSTYAYFATPSSEVIVAVPVGSWGVATAVAVDLSKSLPGATCTAANDVKTMITDGSSAFVTDGSSCMLSVSFTGGAATVKSTTFYSKGTTTDTVGSALSAVGNGFVYSVTYAGYLQMTDVTTLTTTNVQVSGTDAAPASCSNTANVLAVGNSVYFLCNGYFFAYKSLVLVGSVAVPGSTTQNLPFTIGDDVFYTDYSGSVYKWSLLTATPSKVPATTVSLATSAVGVPVVFYPTDANLKPIAVFTNVDGVYAMDSGMNKLWQFTDANLTALGSPLSSLSCTSSKIGSDGLVYAMCNTRIFALNIQTGAVLLVSGSTYAGYSFYTLRSFTVSGAQLFGGFQQGVTSIAYAPINNTRLTTAYLPGTTDANAPRGDDGAPASGSKLWILGVVIAIIVIVVIVLVIVKMKGSPKKEQDYVPMQQPVTAA